MDTFIANNPMIETSRTWPITRVYTGSLPKGTAWHRDDVKESDWLVPMPPECLAEIDTVVCSLRRDPISTLMLTPADFDMPETRRLAANVKKVLDTGIGFVVVDRMSIAEYSKEEMLNIYWLFSQMVARPVAQAFKGTMLYDVRDIGVKSDTSVRGDLTNEDLNWHTDYGYNQAPPYIGLLVHRIALAGGVSSVGSLHTAHEVLREREPRLLRRLYEPFVWNRVGEHPPGGPVCSSQPIFSAYGGVLRARFNKSLQPVGYELVGSKIDQLGMDALNALFDVLSETENHVDFVLSPGQMQFINNHRVAHKRTTYTDHDDPDLKRHLVRIFLRDEGRRSYMG